MIVAGIDLAVNRPTAIAVFRDCTPLYYGLAQTDVDIVSVASLLGPSIVAIDAPLSKPEGGGGLRDVERELRRLGYRLLPPLMGPMRGLTERGIRLSKMIDGRVIEVHPLTSLRAMGMSREDLSRVLGLRHRDLLDAAAAALTAVAYARGFYREIGPFILPTARVCF
ncbi:DUF429 domain-containing protein [Pyrobaculum sp. 3827-6]|uniref:DUF429 domain-containing protein n=1 Tax=Pyrobaculum sp. 3827-6 TaxID=2983604 RepID=UPI0021DAFEDF|nr:DUF429 domain-containing protein [Pyrobaculum sp. 3827-6]MCU7786407.1 DUF429 domain-containing protein [Pyrobaculum sp. 3827-6]